MDAVFSEIEKIIWEDAGRRGLTPFAKHDEIRRSALSLLNGKHIVIVSGFYIEASQTGETDGPSGAVFLARALQQLGKKVTLLTSSYNYSILVEAAAEAEARCDIQVIDKGSETVRFPLLLQDEELTHLVAIEQMGTAIDGNYYNMFGTNLNHCTARFDSLFLMAREKGIVTIGIGDGGNEIGMGNLSSMLCCRPEFQSILCITPVHHLIIAGVSNWGAYGLIAALSQLSGNALLHTPALERDVLEATIRGGAIDGRTLASALTVDALPLEKHIEILEKLTLLVGNSMEDLYDRNVL
jgi:hypothetical protein